jgi:hypothetical protein
MSSLDWLILEIVAARGPCLVGVEFKFFFTSPYCTYYTSALGMNFRMKVYFAKDVTILHLKLGGSCRPNYFLTFTLLEHTSHRHGTADLLQTIDFWYWEIWPTCYKRQLVFDMQRFWHLVWANLMAYKFSLFFLYENFFVHFPNLLRVYK